jgi:hypothetical protein
MGATQHSIDFTNVKEGGNFSKKHMPEGDYLAKVTKVEDAKAKGDGGAMWLFTIQLKGTPSASYPYYCKLEANQFWKIRNLLVAAGLTVPKKKVKVDPNKVVGKQVAVSLQDTEYDGKEQSEVGAIFSPSDLEDEDPNDATDDDAEEEETEDADDEEEPEPKPKTKKKDKGKKKGKAKPAADDDDLEELEIDDL